MSFKGGQYVYPQLPFFLVSRVFTKSDKKSDVYVSRLNSAANLFRCTGSIILAGLIWTFGVHLVAAAKNGKNINEAIQGTQGI